jgi:hypothetical protein
MYVLPKRSYTLFLLVLCCYIHSHICMKLHKEILKRDKLESENRFFVHRHMSAHFKGTYPKVTFILSSHTLTNKHLCKEL